MKTLVSILVALSVLGSIIGPANALDPKSFYGQQERWSH